MCVLKEEEALAQALSHADMGPGEELTPEEEEELQYPGGTRQRNSLEQVIVQQILKDSQVKPSKMIMAVVVVRVVTLGCLYSSCTSGDFGNSKQVGWKSQS